MKINGKLILVIYLGVILEKSIAIGADLWYNSAVKRVIWRKLYEAWYRRTSECRKVHTF